MPVWSQQSAAYPRLPRQTRCLCRRWFWRIGCAAPSLAPSLNDRPYPHCLAYAFQCLLAPVLEPDAGRRPRQRAHRLRDEYFGRRRQPADPSRDVYSAAVDVVVLADDVSGVQAEMQRQPRLVTSASARQRSLDRLPGACEDGEDAVAEQLAFDRRARLLADHPAQRAVQFARLRPERSIA